MSWSTNLFCNISFNRETFNSKSEVEDKILALDLCIERAKRRLSDLALMTEPSKFYSKEYHGSPYNFVHDEFNSNYELLEESIEERTKLFILLRNWDYCHDENGLAINPPEAIKWNTAYLDGDFVKSVKYPDVNEKICG